MVIYGPNYDYEYKISILDQTTPLLGIFKQKKTPWDQIPSCLWQKKMSSTQNCNKFDRLTIKNFELKNKSVKGFESYFFSIKKYC